ncbi:uncharacterized protein LOC126767134, partial [Bactrocera neohumeralis]|uniref:uncharacterized protein LOC126767134 n=1 Tax=Bactrocera neohumeralis TaxID=98809 RepID=UPI00216698A4
PRREKPSANAFYYPKEKALVRAEAVTAEVPAAVEEAVQKPAAPVEAVAAAPAPAIAPPEPEAVVPAEPEAAALPEPEAAALPELEAAASPAPAPVVAKMEPEPTTAEPFFSDASPRQSGLRAPTKPPAYVKSAVKEPLPERLSQPLPPRQEPAAITQKPGKLPTMRVTIRNVDTFGLNSNSNHIPPDELPPELAVLPLTEAPAPVEAPPVEAAAAAPAPAETAAPPAPEPKAVVPPEPKAVVPPEPKAAVLAEPEAAALPEPEGCCSS